MQLAKLFFFVSAHEILTRLLTHLIHLNVSKLRSVDILVMVNVNIHVIVSTIENYANFRQ